MSSEHGKDNGQRTNYGAVEGEPDKFAFFDDVNHPFACQATDKESCQKTYYHSHRTDATEGSADTGVGNFLDIDFYLIHSITDSTIHPYVDDGSVAYFIEQKRQGRIKHLGFSCHSSVEALKWFVEQYDWEFAQLQLNCFDWLYSHTRQEYEVLEQHNIPIMVMEPVRGGRLARLTPEAEALLRGAHPDWSMASWMFRFVQSLPQVQTILSGMSTMEQVEDNLRTFDDDQDFTSADRDLLFQAMDMFKDQMQVPCTACRYCCDDCPMGINIPEYLRLYNKYKVDGDWGLKPQLDAVESTSPPSECLSCGSCTGHCPQSIDIPTIMTEMGEKFFAQ